MNFKIHRVWLLTVITLALFTSNPFRLHSQDIILDAAVPSVPEPPQVVTRHEVCLVVIDNYGSFAFARGCGNTLDAALSCAHQDARDTVGDEYTVDSQPECNSTFPKQYCQDCQSGSSSIMLLPAEATASAPPRKPKPWKLKMRVCMCNGADFNVLGTGDNYCDALTEAKQAARFIANLKHPGVKIRCQCYIIEIQPPICCVERTHHRLFRRAN